MSSRDSLFGIQLYLWFDAPPRRFLCRLACLICQRPCTLRDSNPGAAAGSSVPFIAPIILLALILAAVDGGYLILARHLQLRLDISADSPSLGALGSVAALKVSAIR